MFTGMYEEKRFAVVGNPVLHSKSPLMFNAVFRERFEEAAYIRIAASTAEDAVFLFKELGLSGMNVTAPFKHDIIPYLNSVDTPASLIDGVNTIVREEDKLSGYNTDYIGVVESLKKNGVDIRGKKCVVLGAGGAARAAVYGLVNEKAEVTVVNRTFQKAEEVARSLNCHAEPIERLEDLLKTADIFISTLSAEIDIVPKEWLRNDLVVFDANYKKSSLADKAEERGCVVIKGEAWLLNQAIPAFHHFMGEAPDENEIEIMRTALSAPWPGKLKNISLIGFMGSGKSTVGEILAKKMGFEIVDLDELIEIEAGKSIPEIIRADGWDYFREIESELLKKELECRSGTVLACGGGAALDDDNKDILKAGSLVIWLYSTIPTTLKRLELEPGPRRPLLDVPDFGERAVELLNRRIEHYSNVADLVISSEKSPEEIAENIHEELRRAFGN